MNEVLKAVAMEAGVNDGFNFKMFTVIDDIRGGTREVRTIFRSSNVGREERTMENRKDIASEP